MVNYITWLGINYNISFYATCLLNDRALKYKFMFRLLTRLYTRFVRNKWNLKDNKHGIGRFIIQRSEDLVTSKWNRKESGKRRIRILGFWSRKNAENTRTENRTDSGTKQSLSARSKAERAPPPRPSPSLRDPTDTSPPRGAPQFDQLATTSHMLLLAARAANFSGSPLDRLGESVQWVTSCVRVRRTCDNGGVNRIARLGEDS